MSLTQMFAESGWVARTVIIFLLILSVYSIAVMIEKFMTYRAAKKQSIEFLPILVKCLKDNNLQGAVEKSKQYGKSHIARVVSAGLLEFLNQKSEVAASFDVVGAVTRALERETAITSAEMKKGLGGLATIGSTAPFIGLFGTVFGIINAFTGMAQSGSGGLAAVSAGIAEALITTAFGLLVAIPAVMAFNYFTNRLERFQIEMTNSSAELIDFFLKRHGASYGAH
ncbi:MAG: MotA/TolQ/ExbB proton channel family protein [Acidobacteriia bacterium]|nr:MotA/TolQ/ExbB proton channel family protein [Terriglobia bacterium]